MCPVTIEHNDGIAVVRIDRPPVNAIDPTLSQEIRAATDELTSSLPRAVVWAGRPGSFSAGVDLKAIPQLDEQGRRAMVDGINRMCATWYPFPRPVVIAATGHLIGGGLVFALCGDYRVGSTEGQVGLTETRAGVPYPSGAMEVVRAELPASSSRLMTLRAHLMPPDEALGMGVFDELAQPSRVVERALEVAGELGSLPQHTYARVKQQLRAPTAARLQRIVEAVNRDPHDASWLTEA